MLKMEISRTKQSKNVFFFCQIVVWDLYFFLTVLPTKMAPSAHFVETFRNIQPKSPVLLIFKSSSS